MTTAFGDQKVPMMTSANNVGEGWHALLRTLEDQLNAIDSNYELLQVKEKFGGLRYYAQTHLVDNSAQLRFHELINKAESKSVQICEVCGKPGDIRAGTFGWLKTLCDEHQAERMAHDQKMKEELSDS